MSGKKNPDGTEPNQNNVIAVLLRTRTLWRAAERRMVACQMMYIYAMKTILFVREKDGR